MTLRFEQRRRLFEYAGAAMLPQDHIMTFAERQRLFEYAGAETSQPVHTMTFAQRQRLFELAGSDSGSSGNGNGGTITTGRDLIGMFNITSTATVSPRLDANTGPNAFLKSASYPLPAETDLTGSPLLAIDPAASPNAGRWLFNNDGEAALLIAAWGSINKPYVPSDDPENHGGVVGAGGAVIDGYPVAAGSYVLQFLDFQAMTLALDGDSTTPGIMVRGCRNRSAWGPGTGAFNCPNWQGELHVHYCDIGGQSALLAGGAQYGISASGGHNFSLYRNYVSYACDLFVCNPQQAGYNDTVENVAEKVSLYPDAGTEHLDAWQTNGNAPNARLLRNRFVAAANDDEGNLVNQTGAISFFGDFGNFPGTGTNLDGSTGYVVAGNYLGGFGYPLYAGDQPPGTMSNLTLEDNLITTSEFELGGFNGPITFPPVWGSNGNSQARNNWADGPNAGNSFIS